MSGDPGSGKSTIGKMLAKKLKYKRYNMGEIFRDVAKKKGMTLHELHEELKKGNGDLDKEVDDYQKKLGQEKDNFLIEGRTSFHFIPHSLKIFLSVDLKIAAERIFKEMQSKNKRNEGKFSSAEEVYKNTIARIKKDNDRYKKLYGLKYDDKSHYDIVIDTTNKSIKEVFDAVYSAVSSKL